jgi:hypothetical protein
MTSNSTEPFSAEKYFATQLPPKNLQEILEGVRQFVETNHYRRRRIVLVTVSPPGFPIRFPIFSVRQLLLMCLDQSGGTTVPLELNVYVSSDPKTLTYRFYQRSIS